MTLNEPSQYQSTRNQSSPAAASEADDDHQLMLAIQNNDQAALAQLYDRHAAAMMGIAYRILSNRRDAEDLLHDVFLEAWHKASHYDATRGTVKTWLITRLRSRAIDRLRTLTQVQKHTALQNHDTQSNEQIIDEVSQTMEFTFVNRALASLSQVQRTVIELSYFKGMTQHEIAIRCDVPVGTVKSRLSTAIKILRSKLSSSEETS